MAISRRLIVSIITVVFCLDSTAQEVSDDPVIYSIVENNPDRMFMGVNFNYQAGISVYNMSLLTVGLDAVVLSKRFRLDLESRLDIDDRLSTGFFNQPYAFSIYQTEMSRDFSVIGTYYFKSEVKREEATEVNVARVGNTIYQIVIPVDHSYRMGIDLGLTSGVTYFDFGNKDVAGTDMLGNTDTLISSTTSRTISSYYNYGILRLGISRGVASNLVIDTDKYGQKRKSGISKIYGQILLSVYGMVDDIFVPQNINNPTDPYVRYDINQGLKRVPVGLCVGTNFYNTGAYLKRAGVGVGFDAEVGILPLPVTSFKNLVYLDLKMRIGFSKYLN